MFGKAKPKAPVVTAAASVGGLAADALMGSLTMDFSTGYALVKTFAAYNANPNKDDALSVFCDTLMKHDPMLAGRLVDALAARIGR